LACVCVLAGVFRAGAAWCGDMGAGTRYGRGCLRLLRPEGLAMPLNRVPSAGASYACSCECGCASRVRRYPTDLTDAQWAALEPLLPVMLCATALGGRPELHSRRAMVDAVFYLAGNGIKWRAMPADFPPWKTVWGMCARWKKDGVLRSLRVEDDPDRSGPSLPRRPSAYLGRMVACCQRPNSDLLEACWCPCQYPFSARQPA
jgi:hypothetical protein